MAGGIWSPLQRWKIQQPAGGEFAPVLVTIGGTELTGLYAAYLAMARSVRKRTELSFLYDNVRLLTANSSTIRSGGGGENRTGCAVIRNSIYTSCTEEYVVTISAKVPVSACGKPDKHVLVELAPERARAVRAGAAAW